MLHFSNLIFLPINFAKNQNDEHDISFFQNIFLPICMHVWFTITFVSEEKKKSLSNWTKSSKRCFFSLSVFVLFHSLEENVNACNKMTEMSSKRLQVTNSETLLIFFLERNVWQDKQNANSRSNKKRPSNIYSQHLCVERWSSKIIYWIKEKKEAKGFSWTNAWNW